LAERTFASSKISHFSCSKKDSRLLQGKLAHYLLYKCLGGKKQGSKICKLLIRAGNRNLTLIFKKTVENQLDFTVFYLPRLILSRKFTI